MTAHLENARSKGVTLEPVHHFDGETASGLAGALPAVLDAGRRFTTPSGALG